MTELYDIVIVGAGPCGLLLSTLLARWHYRVLHIDNRPEPTPCGRADGIQPRSLELLKNMGLKSAIMAHKPARIFSVAFWENGHGEARVPYSGRVDEDGIKRVGTHPSCPDFIDTRYNWTTLLHQGHIERAFLDDMKSNGTEVLRPWTIADFEVNDGESYPVTLDIQRLEGASQTGGGVGREKKTIQAKYLFGGEGARSFVREKLGIKMIYNDPTEFIWAVMDGRVKTDFPDIKMKCTIRSARGSIMVIPRENNMVRLYIQLPSPPKCSSEKEASEHRAAARKVLIEDVQAAAKKALSPYNIEWETVNWYSVYPIGQGVAEHYSGCNERVFIGGDACHTHSPKAGQGMNTAFLDALNLAWKIHLVEQKFADREILKTYETERRCVADKLLEFDQKYAALFSGKGPKAHDVHQMHEDGSASPSNEFLETFKKACEFTSGYGVRYGNNVFNLLEHPFNSSLEDIGGVFDMPGLKLTPGRMLPPATVTRVADANQVHLEQEIGTNGAWRIYVFAGRNRSALASFAEYLDSTGSFYSRYKYSGPERERLSHHERTNPDSRFFSIALIMATKRSEVEISDLPCLFARHGGLVYADDIKDMRWAPEAPQYAATHAKYGIEIEDGGVIVVRPDGYIGCVVNLSDGRRAGEALERYYSQFMAKSNCDKLDHSDIAGVVTPPTSRSNSPSRI